jgi:hypothetical protein
MLHSSWGIMSPAEYEQTLKVHHHAASQAA